MKSLLVAILYFATNGYAADIYLSKEYGGQVARAGIPAHEVERLVISGTIEEGDSQKLIALAKSAPERFYSAIYSVNLDSDGGDIREAMKIAVILKTLYPAIGVKPQGNCVSACLLLWLSGSTRSYGSIGIHRPYFNPAYFRGLSMAEAEKQYAAMSDEFRTFVLQQGLPQSLYEKLIATPSTSVYWLTPQDIMLIGPFPPYYHERLLASCGDVIDDRREFIICAQRMVAPDRIRGIDRILDGKKDEGWEYYKKRELLPR